MALPDIKTVVEIAEGAGEKILELYERGDLPVREKEDASPVTAADLESHEYIRTKLEAAADYPVVSEEAPVPYEIRRSWPAFWLVDPLDGTKDFIQRTDEFTVNIALIEGDRPVMGIVHIPAWRVTYYAAAGRGAFKKKGPSTDRICCAAPRGETICLDSRFHSSPKTAEFCARYGIDKVLSFGSSIKICKIAEGAAHVYPRYQPTKEWDTAAGHCILSESNGTIIDGESGLELRYNKPAILNNPFVAQGDGFRFSL